jgi:hypothetical protein
MRSAVSSWGPSLRSAGLAEDDVIAAVPKQPVPGVRITHSGRQARRRQQERSHDWLPTIDQPVRTGRAFMEAHEIAGVEPRLALRVAQRGRPGQDQQPLLPPVHVAVGLRSLSRIQLHHRPDKPVGAQQRAEFRRPIPRPRRSDGPAVPSPCQ